MNDLFDLNEIQYSIGILHYLYITNPNIRNKFNNSFSENTLDIIRSNKAPMSSSKELKSLHESILSLVSQNYLLSDSELSSANKIINQCQTINKAVKDKKTTRNIRLFKEYLDKGEISKTYETHLNEFLKKHSDHDLDLMKIRENQISYGSVKNNIGEIIPGEYLIFRHSYADKGYINISKLSIHEDKEKNIFTYENERKNKSKSLHYYSKGIIYQVSNKTIVLDGISYSMNQNNHNSFTEFMSLRVPSANSGYYYFGIPLSGLFLGLRDGQTPAAFRVLLLPVKNSTHFEATSIEDNEKDIKEFLHLIYEERKLPLNKTKKLTSETLKKAIDIEVNEFYNCITHFKDY